MVQRTKSRECERNKDALILVIYLPGPYLHMGSSLQMKGVWSCCFSRLIKKAFDQKYITSWANLLGETHKLVFGIKTSRAQPKMLLGKWHIKPGLAFNFLLPIKLCSTTLEVFYSLSHIFSSFPCPMLSRWVRPHQGEHVGLWRWSPKLRQGVPLR